MNNWTQIKDQMPPPDEWLLVVWESGGKKFVDKAHTFMKWKHPSNPLGYLIQGHPGSHNAVIEWQLLPEPSDAEMTAERGSVGEIADAGRVIEWALDPSRKPAVHAFTSGPERQAAYWIEWAESRIQNGGDNARAG